MSSDNNKCACGSEMVGGECGMMKLVADISPKIAQMGEWVPYVDPEKEALRKELEDAKKELAEAKSQLSQVIPPRKFKVSHEVVFTPKTDDQTS